MVRAGISLKSPLFKRGHNLRGVPKATATFVYECLCFKVAVATTAKDVRQKKKGAGMAPFKSVGRREGDRGVSDINNSSHSQNVNPVPNSNTW